MPRPDSLQRLLARWLIGPLTGLIVVSGIPAYVTAIGAARDAYDSALLDPALAIASHLHVADDRIEIGLPGMDGFEVLRQLRKNRETGSILILTVHDAEPDRIRGLDLGADDYVTKPFSLPEFEARVRALIRRSQAVRSPTLRLGTLTIDSTARRAQIGGEDLELTPREWGVLEYLLTRAGQVVSKEQMLQALCSWDDSLTHNAIEVYISRLRGKLQKAGIKIRTVRGFGYMVEDPDAPAR